MISTLRRPLVGPLLHTRFFYALAFSLFQSVFTLYALYRFDLDSQNTGYILAYVGLLSVITQGVLIRPLTARFSERVLLLASVIIMAAGMTGWALVPSIPLLLVVLAPVAVAGGVFNTVINSAISKTVMPAEVGGTLGLAASLEALTRVISPSLGGVLLEKISTAAPGLFGAVILLWLLTYVFRFVARPAAVQAGWEQ